MSPRHQKWQLTNNTKDPNAYNGWDLSALPTTDL